MTNVICTQCNEEIYEILSPIISGGTVQASQFKSLNPEEYKDPVDGQAMECPKCGESFPTGNGCIVRILTTDGIKP